MVHTKYASQAISGSTDLMREGLATENKAEHGQPGVVKAWSDARSMSAKALKSMLAADTAGSDWLNTYRERCLISVKHGRRGAVRFGKVPGKNFKTEVPKDLMGCF